MADQYSSLVNYRKFMLYSLVAAFFVFLSIVLPPMLATKSTDKTGLVVYFFISIFIFFGALVFDLAAFFSRYPMRYSLIVACCTFIFILSVDMFMPKSFFDSGFYAIFTYISITILFVALATLFYKLIGLLIKLLQ